MKPLHDYFYRFPREYLQTPGRCRVRIYKRKNGTHTVVLTELNHNPGESITSACTQIATQLAATKGLNPKTTRWIQHEPQYADVEDGKMDHVFDELEFTWDDRNRAHTPKWQSRDIEQVEALTGDSQEALSRGLGETEANNAEPATTKTQHTNANHANAQHTTAQHTTAQYEEGIKREPAQTQSAA